jgi:hypothetical protein
MAISDTLRQAIRDSGQSVLAIAKAAGIAQPRLHYFLQGRSMTSKNMDALATYFCLVLRPAKGKPSDRKSC